MSGSPHFLPSVRDVRLAGPVCTLLIALAPLPALGENFLFVLLDDVGVDKVAAYAEAPSPPPTPTLDALAREGVLFRNAWANATCSPTRAAMLTGQRAERTGVGTGLPPGPGLATDVLTIADVLREQGYATAAMGKWHLAHPPDHPLQVGFDTHRGARSNVGPGGYQNWRKFIDGVDQGKQSSYATTDTADDTIAWIAAQTQPWFVWLSFNAPHLPLHAPPAMLHSQGDLGGASAPRLYAAMLEAVDRELGRIVAAAGADTTVLVMGDNGTYERAIEPPFDPARGKRSAYEGGVRVPLIVAGPAVRSTNRGAESAALVQATDLFATLAELAGSRASAEDSISFAAQLADAAAAGRQTMYTSWFKPNGGPPDSGQYHRAVRNARFKLIRQLQPRHELYDLVADPHEKHDLLRGALTPDAREAQTQLSAVIDALEWHADAPAQSSLAGRVALALGAILALAIVAARLRSRRGPA